MDKIEHAARIYHHEGFRSLMHAIRRHFKSHYLPVPEVTDPGLSDIPFLLTPIYNWRFSRRYGSGADIIREDWDTLILLDACRFDDFESANQLQGELSSRISRGVDSYEFISRNFVGRRLHDLVYVTANPHVRLLNGNEFHAVITDPIDQWDTDVGCVRPESVTAAAKDAHQQYPNKRIIVHYMQPHDPPLGPTGQILREKYQIAGPITNDSSKDNNRVMKLVAKGVIPTSVARKAYRETLAMALEEVGSLAEMVNGKVVISADHGEHFGEEPYKLLGPLYEHYRNPRTVELCKVPWFILDTGGSRRKIVSGEPNQEPVMSGRVIENQLKALGYQ
jgi:hypothetical protein